MRITQNNRVKEPGEITTTQPCNRLFDVCGSLWKPVVWHFDNNRDRAGPSPFLPLSSVSPHLTSTSFTTLGWSSFLRMAISWYTCSMGPLGWMQPLGAGRVPRGGGRPGGDMNHPRVRAKDFPLQRGTVGRTNEVGGGSQKGWNG